MPDQFLGWPQGNALLTPPQWGDDVRVDRLRSGADNLGGVPMRSARGWGGQPGPDVGAKWTTRYKDPSTDYAAITWSPELGIFLSCGGSGKMFWSNDGIAWTAFVLASAWQNAAIVWSPELGIFVVFRAANHPGQVAILRTGKTAETSVTCPNPNSTATNYYNNGALWSKELGLFVATTNANNYRIVTSPDGLTWTFQATSVDNTWQGLCWAPELGLLVAVASSGTGNRVMTSPDGVNWTTQTSAADNQWVSVCWSSDLNLLVAVSSNGSGNRVMTSPDGVNWTTQASAADNVWSSVCWVRELGLFVAVGQTVSGNQVMTSSNGVNWQTRAQSTPSFWRQVVWASGLNLLVAVGSNTISTDYETIMTSGGL